MLRSEILNIATINQLIGHIHLHSPHEHMEVQVMQSEGRHRIVTTFSFKCFSESLYDCGLPIIPFPLIEEICIEATEFGNLNYKAPQEIFQ